MESTTLSVSSWRMSRDGPPPSAWRSAISRARAVARVSRRLATFAHAMSKTSATAPNRNNNGWRTSPFTHRSSGTSRTRQSLAGG